MLRIGPYKPNIYWCRTLFSFRMVLLLNGVQVYTTTLWHIVNCGIMCHLRLLRYLPFYSFCLWRAHYSMMLHTRLPHEARCHIEAFTMRKFIHIHFSIFFCYRSQSHMHAEIMLDSAFKIENSPFDALVAS